MTDIFVSYASEDRERVRPLVERLTAQGWSVWWDRELETGSSFETTIEQALASARCVVIAWSQHSINSRWCRAEATEGLERDKLVPLLIDDVRPPLVFRATHTANMLGWPENDGQLDSVFAAIGKLLDEPIAVAPASSPSQKGSAWPTKAGVAAGVLILALMSWWFVDSQDQSTVMQQTAKQISPEAIVESQKPLKVAVMPIRDLSNDPDGVWLAGGLTEELRREISGWNRYEVLPGALTRGREANDLSKIVDVILDGYLSRDDNDAIVALDIIHLAEPNKSTTSTASASWSEPRRLQRQIAGNFSLVLDVSLSEDAQILPADHAWSSYLRHVHAGIFGDYEEIIYWLERTLEEDPEWTVGWATLALRRHQMFVHLNDPQQLRMAQAALANAAKNPNQALWGWAWAQVQGYGLGNFEQAYPWFVGYVSEPLIPAYFLPQFLLQLGMNEEATEPFRRAVERNPNIVNFYQGLAMNEALLGNFERSEAAARRFVDLNPPNSYPALQLAAIERIAAGDLATAEDHFRKLQISVEATKPGSLAQLDSKVYLRWVAAALATANNDAAAIEPLIKEFLEYGDVVSAALYTLYFDDPQTAEALLDADLAQDSGHHRNSWFISRVIMPAEYRNHPLVQRIEQHLGYTNEWRLKVCMHLASFNANADLAHLGYSCSPGNYE